MPDAAKTTRAHQHAIPKKRGRPRKADAMSPAERKRKQRERDMRRFNEAPENWTEATCIGILTDRKLSLQSYEAAFRQLMALRGRLAQ